ncbi:MAG: hypothetical protein Q8Q25_02585 [bacterium]|nr:hypothetical protein [bacterium]
MKKNNLFLSLSALLICFNTMAIDSTPDTTISETIGREWVLIESTETQKNESLPLTQHELFLKLISDHGVEPSTLFALVTTYNSHVPENKQANLAHLTSAIALFKGAKLAAQTYGSSIVAALNANKRAKQMGLDKFAQRTEALVKKIYELPGAESVTIMGIDVLLSFIPKKANDIKS